MRTDPSDGNIAGQPSLWKVLRRSCCVSAFMRHNYVCFNYTHTACITPGRIVKAPAHLSLFTPRMAMSRAAFRFPRSECDGNARCYRLSARAHFNGRNVIFRLNYDSRPGCRFAPGSQSCSQNCSPKCSAIHFARENTQSLNSIEGNRGKVACRITVSFRVTSYKPHYGRVLPSMTRLVCLSNCYNLTL